VNFATEDGVMLRHAAAPPASPIEAQKCARVAQALRRGRHQSKQCIFSYLWKSNRLKSRF
jgi:hypothetical protein